jgi:AcrR family transcriptional regulator
MSGLTKKKKSLQECHRGIASATRISLPSEQTTLGLRKWPSQRRAEATVVVILEGAAQILERGGSFTTNTIADRAGVSIGTLYQYFDAKEAVAAELSRRARSGLVRSVATAIEAVKPLALAKGLPIVIRAALDAEKHRPRLAIALDRLENKLPLASDDACVVTMLRNHIVPWLHQHYPRECLRDLDVLADDLHAVVRALTNAAYMRNEFIGEQFVERTASTLMAIVSARLAAQALSI